jgi:hypothetical protein
MAVIGRPSLYSDELAALILGRISDGESLRKICLDAEMPDRETVRRWLLQNEAFCGQYARAREEQADTLADEITDIADGNDAPDNKRVRIDARKWVAGKLRPKKYGERTAHEHTGPGGGAIVLQVKADDLGLL